MIMGREVGSKGESKPPLASRYGTTKREMYRPNLTYVCETSRHA